METSRRAAVAQLGDQESQKEGQQQDTWGGGELRTAAGLNVRIGICARVETGKVWKERKRGIYHMCPRTPNMTSSYGFHCSIFDRITIYRCNSSYRFLRSHCSHSEPWKSPFKPELQCLRWLGDPTSSSPRKPFSLPFRSSDSSSLLLLTNYYVWLLG